VDKLNAPAAYTAAKAKPTTVPVINAMKAAMNVQTRGKSNAGQKGGLLLFDLSFFGRSKLGEGGRVGLGVGVEEYLERDLEEERWTVRERMIVKEARREQMRKIPHRIVNVQKNVKRHIARLNKHWISCSSPS